VHLKKQWNGRVCFSFCVDKRELWSDSHFALTVFCFCFTVTPEEDKQRRQDEVDRTQPKFCKNCREQYVEAENKFNSCNFYFSQLTFCNVV
jgi:hypothetical protein